MVEKEVKRQLQDLKPSEPLKDIDPNEFRPLLDAIRTEASALERRIARLETTGQQMADNLKSQPASAPMATDQYVTKGRMDEMWTFLKDMKSTYANLSNQLGEGS